MEWQSSGGWDASLGHASYMMNGDASDGQSAGTGASRLPGGEDSRHAAAGAARMTSVPTTRLASSSSATAADDGGAQSVHEDPWLEAARQLVDATSPSTRGPLGASAAGCPGGLGAQHVVPNVWGPYQGSGLPGGPVAPYGLFPPGCGPPGPPHGHAGPPPGLSVAGGSSTQLPQHPGLAPPGGRFSSTNPMGATSSVNFFPFGVGPGGWGSGGDRPGGAPRTGPWWEGSGCAGGYKGDYSDPPAWPGWSYRRQWVAAIRRWNKQTDVPLFRRAEKVLRTLGWDMQVDFEHLTETQLISEHYLECILQIIEMKAGVREDDERRQAYKGVMHDSGRRRDETLAQYAMRRLRDFTRTASHGLHLPSELKATMLREGSGLSEQGLQNLTALMQGEDHNVDRLAATLARMDVRSDRVVAFQHEGDVRNENSSFLAEEERSESDDDGSESSERELWDETVLHGLSDMNFTEEQAALVFALVENRPPFKKRTWKENKKFKAERRKDRGSFSKGGDGRGSGTVGSKPKWSKEQLKKISRCRTCGKKGHWSEDCRLAKDGVPDVSKVTGFCYLGPAEGGGSTHYSYAVHMADSDLMKGEKQLGPWAFLSIPPGMAILDIGATQDIIGKAALSALECELAGKGLKTVEIPAPAAAPTGIGGQARVEKAILMPIALGGVPGVHGQVHRDRHSRAALVVGRLLGPFGHYHGPHNR